MVDSRWDMWTQFLILREQLLPEPAHLFHEFIEQYVHSYNVKDEKGILALFSKNISGFGMARDAIVMNFTWFRKMIRSDISPANAIWFDITILATGREGPGVWVTGLCTFGGSISGKRIHMDGRMTAVLANHGNK
jgi:hypothetical protein